MKNLIATAPARKNEFVRACFLQARAGIRNQSVHDLIRSDEVVIRALIDRAAVLPATTTQPGNAAELVQTAFPAFLASLAPYGAASAILTGALPAALRNADRAKYPVRSGQPTSPQWVGEGDAIPINIADFSLIEVGPRRKLASIIPWTQELNKRSDAEAVFEQLLREDVAAGLDAAMLSNTAGSVSAYPGLLYGVSPIGGYAGGDVLAIQEDLIALGTAVSVNGGSGQVLYIMAPEQALRLKVKAPLLASNLDIAVSAAIANGKVVAVDPAGIISGVDTMPDIYFADQSVLHMDSEPLPISEGVVAAPVRSLWQTASQALRIIMDVAWAKRRANAAAWLANATW